ncbi:hypothetical protein M501DRAFT_312998 [Patellaria atrata CBS 101060]|uniref:Uncharacterized protein n=1 Tax=Patellaria atrata CBS 101060 TaxID=1346257 RepID=A0A9P4S4B8_9PEZI|nr:hypothetical protein M501DRAFT_312998 [Patellaria atrata CBS 101060]
MSSEEEILSNIRNHAASIRNARENQMELDDTDTTEFEARLDRTLKELQARVAKQKAALEQLRASSTSPLPTTPSPDSRTRLLQLRTIRAAYRQLTPSEPYLPPSSSALPALLAIRDVRRTIAATRSAISTTQTQLNATQRALERSSADLHDSQLLRKALEDRIERLRAQQLAKSQKNASQVAKEMVRAKQKRGQEYDSEIVRLREALHTFIHTHVAGMLAAEELGGPVVGDLMEVDEETLEAGFSAQGKPKASKGGSSSKEDKRQRRIDEIWGSANRQEDAPRSESEAAASELKALINDLFDALLGENSSDVYVQLPRDSAAARFLVRSKVAQFHPKDARRLRLIDFGRELDD